MLFYASCLQNDELVIREAQGNPIWRLMGSIQHYYLFISQNKKMAKLVELLKVMKYKKVSFQDHCINHVRNKTLQQTCIEYIVLSLYMNNNAVLDFLSISIKVQLKQVRMFSVHMNIGHLL